MRPIDADELKRVIMSKRHLLSRGNICDFGMFTSEIINVIDKAPTVEPKQGEWIDHGYSFYICNNCGMGNNNAGGCKTNFCPNCGADMRKGSAENTFNDYLNEQLKDPKFKKEWEKLCDEDMRSDEE